MFSLIIETYLKRAQQLSRLIDRNPSSLQELLHLIEINKDSVKLDSGKEEFFKGEYAFYSGHYEIALKHYLESKSVIKYEFFCFRTSAFISKGHTSIEKAIGYIKKALEIFPDDYPSLVLYGELLTQVGRYQESKEISAKTLALAEQALQNFEHEASKTSKVSIGENEIKELAGIFSENYTGEGLFAANEAKIKTSSTHSTHSRGYSEYSSIGTTPSLSDSLQVCQPLAPYLNSPTETALDTSNTSFHTLQTRIACEYFTKWKNRSPLLDHSLYILQGWQQPPNEFQEQTLANEEMLSMLYEGAHKSSGGFYIRWQNKGIVINPGKHFITNFHQAGLHVKDIDFVIATSDEPNTYADIQKIYELSYQLNRRSGSEEGYQVIQYYLHQSVYQKLYGTLKPHSKQERYSVHKLELFADAPEEEVVDLHQNICLHFFSTSTPSTHPYDRHDKTALAMGILLELSCPNPNQEQIPTKIRLGFISESKLTPATSQALGNCNLLIASLSSDPQPEMEYPRLQHFIEEYKPFIVLCSDFNGFNGDQRLETVKKIRKASSGNTSILPADIGLQIDLKSMQLKCSDLEFVEPNLARVVRSTGAFSRLLYVAPSCAL